MNGFREPTRDELRIIQARRERTDRISKLMGDYLLKGYRMLDAYCPQCMNILLKSRSGQNYCVACEEVDNENPQGTSETAVSNADPQSHATLESTPDILTPQIIGEFPLNKVDQYATAANLIAGNQTEQKSQSGGQKQVPKASRRLVSQSTVDFVRSAIEEKMEGAAGMLKDADTEEAKRLLDLIRDCSYTLSMLSKDCVGT